MVISSLRDRLSKGLDARPHAREKGGEQRVPLPPSSSARRASHGPKILFPFPLKRIISHLYFQRSLMGFPGIPGSNGIPGVPGVPGPHGPQGREGVKGRIGDKGSQGMPGPIGDRGLVGPPWEEWTPRN